MPKLLRSWSPSFPPGPVAVLAGLLCLWSEPATCDWQTFNSADGLADDTVWVVFEDSSENLWFGTPEGLSRYDGVVWTTYTEADGLASNGARPILEDASGDLWVGSWSDAGRGVSRYDGTSWTTFTEAGGVPIGLPLLGDSRGNVWFSATDGIIRFDGTTWKVFGTQDGLDRHGVVEDILEDSSGAIWVASEAPSGLARYKDGGWTSFTAADGLASNWVRDILEDASGAMWLATQGGVNRYRGGTWETYTTADGLPGNNVNWIFEDSRGSLWVGSLSELARFDGTAWGPVPTPALSGGYPTPYGMVEDPSGNLWVRSTQDLMRYDGWNWTVYPSGDGPAPGDILAMTIDSSGNLWAGSEMGASRFDGTSWDTFTAANGILGNDIQAVAEGDSGDIWVGTAAGASRFDGVAWNVPRSSGGTYWTGNVHALLNHAGATWAGTWYGSGISVFAGDTVSASYSLELPNPWVGALFEDSAGRVWVGTLSGVARFDDGNWTTFAAPADSIPLISVLAIGEDPSGAMWFSNSVPNAGGRGVVRYDGNAWTTYTTEDGLAGDLVWSIARDSTGAMWFGTDGGASRFDGSTWTTLTTADGLPDNTVRSLFTDDAGDLWLGTERGVARYRSGITGAYGAQPGRLQGDLVQGIIQDRGGTLWFATDFGVTRLRPDRVGPQTVISFKSPRISANTVQTLGYAAAFREFEGVRFSYSLDGAPWSPWSTVNSWVGKSLPDGHHRFEVKSIDLIGNQDRTPAAWEFTIDSAPPVPVIASPAFGEAVRDSVPILGTADDSRFREYKVEYRVPGGDLWNPLGTSTSPVTGGLLGAWNTTGVPDGEYQLRVLELDDLGLTGTAVITVIVDNQAPFVEVTAPATVTSAGGDVYTTDGNLHLYFPPHSFSRDVVVDIAVSDPAPSGSPVSGATPASPGYTIGWENETLLKTAALTMATPDGVSSTGTRAVYRLGDGNAWTRIGGTETEGSLSLPLADPGTYALFVETTSARGPSALSGLALTPRAFSPTGGFASREVAISFVVGSPGPVKVGIYNRAGRLVRSVAGSTMPAGANLVRWDGRDGGGSLVPDGLYIVAVQAGQKTLTRTLSVVR